MPARISHADGYLTLSRNGSVAEVYYYLKDHLGNVRSVITPYNDSLIVVQTNDYFPFGMSFSRAIAHSDNTNKHKYNGKEEQEMPGKWLDYGARFYDAQLGRFHTSDPFSEKFSFQSPFVYAANNPIRFIDWMGMGPGDPPGNQNYWINKTIGPTVNAINNKVNNAINYIKNIANDPVTQDVLTMAGGALSIATLNPVGIALGVPTLGIGTGKAIAHSNPDTFDQEKVDMAKNTVTGNLTKAIVTTIGGDAELAGDIADGVENIVKGGKGLFDIATKTTKTIDAVDATITTAQGIEAIHEVIESTNQGIKEDNKK